MVRDRDRMFREQVTKKTELGWKKVSEKRKEKRKRKPVSRTKQHSSTAQQQERKANRLESRKISADPRASSDHRVEDNRTRRFSHGSQ